MKEAVDVAGPSLSVHPFPVYVTNCCRHVSSSVRARKYMATINGVGNSTTSNTFTVTANMTVTPSSISCSPADLMIQFVGNGQGSFAPHEL